MEEIKTIFVVLENDAIARIEVRPTSNLQQILNISNKIIENKTNLPSENFSVTLYYDKKNNLPSSMLRDPSIQKIFPYSELKTGKSFIRYQKQFTGIKDVDKMILQGLDDRDLLQTCRISTYMRGLCTDDNFWKSRFFQYYPQNAAEYKFSNESWKEYYLDGLSYNLDRFMDVMDQYMYQPSMKWEPDMEFELISENSFSKRDIERPFHLARSTPYKKIEIIYPVDRYQEVDPVERVYETDTFFTPYEIMTFIAKFYDEPISMNNFIDNVNVENPYAGDYTEEQVRQGKVRRGDMIPNLFFEGLSYNVYPELGKILAEVNFGS